MHKLKRKTKLKTVYKLKWKNALKLVFILAIAVGLILLGIEAFTFFKDRNKIVALSKEISEKVEVKPKVDDEETKTVKPDPKLSKFDIYWDYIKLPLLDVDMGSLKKMNSDSIGYVEIKNTSFSYPIVQKDDEFYRTHSFDKKENKFGWIYLDAKASISEMDVNTIIYGNKVWSKILASSLKELFTNDWKENDDNFVIKYSTSHYSTLFQILSVYEVKGKSHLKTEFANEEELKEFIDNSINLSQIKFKTDAKTTDKFLTITTNSNGKNIVVFAKLIKYRTE